MRSRLGLVATLAVAATASAAGYRSATTPRAFRFPADHASHPDYRVEWWYYTGNVAAGSRAFGYQLTFFRVGIDPAWRESRSAWAPHDVLFAHLALTDVQRLSYRFFERVERPALSMAGADTARYRVWIDDWEAELLPDGRTHRLQARAPDLKLDLRLVPRKPPVIHGAHGLSLKSAAPGNASHYYSLTRLETSGTVKVGPDSFAVHGLTWMDHEFSTSQLDSSQVGWDWFGLQLDSGEELMLYQLRRRDGSIEPLSSGTWVARDGHGTYLPRSAFTIEATSHWKSPHSGADYPHGWRIRVPSQGVDMTVTPAVDDQELTTRAIGGVVYWEGSVRVAGSERGAPISGRGYVELTGYAGAPPGLTPGR